MRVTSAIWTSALVRRCNSIGVVATLAKRGAEEAGAIFVIVDRLDGRADLYGPAPQTSFDETRPSDRKFQRIIETGTLPAIAERLDRESRFDPDLWIVALEDREGGVFFDLV